MSADPNVMTREEYARVVAEVEALLPVPMRDPKGRTVISSAARVQARLDAGYTLTEK